MAERASVFQGVQLGVESTPGTQVAADKKLQSIGISPSINSESDPFRPMGSKWPTLVVQNREWVQASLEGKPTYDELAYLLSSVLTAGDVTSPGAGDARLWTFEPASASEDAPKTFTVEQGDTSQAHRFGYGIVTEFGLDISRGGIDLSGTMLGQRLESGITLTGSPTTLPLVPVLPTQVDVYLDDTPGDLGTTKLTRAFTANLSVGDRFGPVWPLDSDNDSYAAHVETEPSGSLELTVAADSQGMGILPLLRSGDTRFLRVEATGPEIGSGDNYRLTLDLAGKVESVSDFSDEDGVYAIGWTFQIVHDGDWGQALKVELQNTLEAL